MDSVIDNEGKIICGFPNRKMRKFSSGATRDDDINKLDYEGFISPLVLLRYAQYMHQHRTQADGKLRDSDNWQKGIPIKQYMKSKWRHFVDTWTNYRLGMSVGDTAILEDSLCAELFNTNGMLHEILKNKEKKGDKFDE